MGETTNVQVESSLINHYCPICADTMVHKDALTEFPMFSGWECPECGFFELD